jgi:hypothetical protein
MKLILASFLFLSAQQAGAEPINVGCAIRTYDCSVSKCSWGTDVGNLQVLDLQKTGTSANYEIWQGNIHGVAKDKYPYTVSIYQRREPQQTFNFITIDLKIKGVTVSAVGQNVAETRHLIDTTNEGIGLHCTTDLTPGR